MNEKDEIDEVDEEEEELEDEEDDEADTQADVSDEGEEDLDDEEDEEDLKAEAIPAEHPAMPQLERLFGDHTYFLDSGGLSIVEPLEEEEGNGSRGLVVNLAHWADATTMSLLPHPPQSMELVVDLRTDSR